MIDNIIVVIRIMKSFELRKVMKIENKTAESTKLQTMVFIFIETKLGSIPVVISRN